MPREETMQRLSALWAASIQECFGDTPPVSKKWTSPAACVQIILAFAGEGRNHCFFPTGGGLDIQDVRQSREPGCIEIEVNEKMVEVGRVLSLTFEHIEQDPDQSFLMLELAPLEPSGVYEDPGMREELVELSPGHYVNRNVWDDGVVGHDEHGHDLPLPDGARLVTRWLGGKMLIVSKPSIWNQSPETYDGRHDRMSPQDVRRIIENTLEKLASR